MKKYRVSFFILHGKNLIGFDLFIVFSISLEQWKNFASFFIYVLQYVLNINIFSYIGIFVWDSNIISIFNL